jgi:hypothetical protein
LIHRASSSLRLGHRSGVHDWYRAHDRVTSPGFAREKCPLGRYVPALDVPRAKSGASSSYVGAAAFGNPGSSFA